jgi:hypothetical protein
MNRLYSPEPFQSPYWQQYVGQQVASSSAPAPGSLAAQGYTADQGAEIGIAVSGLPLVGALLGAIVLGALAPSDVVPVWAWALLGAGVGLVAGNQLGVAVVNQIAPANAAVNPALPSSSFNEVSFYQGIAQSASSQLASYIAAQQTASASTAPVVSAPSTS